MKNEQQLISYLTDRADKPSSISIIYFIQKRVVFVSTEKHAGVPVKLTWWTVQDDVDDILQHDDGICDSL